MTGSVTTISQRAKVLRRITGEVLRTEGGKVISFARSRWPVDTGRSKAGLRVEIVDELTIRLVCRVNALGAGGRPKPDSNYSEYIVSGGVRPWREYIAVPAAAMGRFAAREIGKRFLAAMKVR